MPCPASGQISISDLVAEFGGTAPHSMSEYYRNGDLVPSNNTNVPTSGEFSLTNCYSAVNEILHTHSDGDTHADLATIFGSNWASTVPKRVVVPSGVTVGGTSTHAMNVPSGMGGTLNIVVSGNIHGHGGAANGGNGGNAINCVQTTGVTITLNSGGSIKAGGGGGGQGGTGGTGGNGGAGGQGGQGRYKGFGSYRYFENAWNAAQACNGSYVGSPTNWSSNGQAPPNNYAGTQTNTVWHSQGYWHDRYRTTCESWFYTTGGSGGAGSTSGGAGGAGGAGGVGQGYNQSAASGSSGASGASGGSGASGASGGSNAGTGGTGGASGQGGTGGTGGTGGAFGASGNAGGTGDQGATGSTGSTGTNGNYANGAAGSAGSAGASGASGASGGAAGYYIYNRASITFNNSGTVAGQ